MIYVVVDKTYNENDRGNFNEVPSLEIQTYLPNLYYRKYKLIERLNGLRLGFPTMQNPQTNANKPRERPLTGWDKVLQDVAIKVKTMQEIKKYKIAQKAFLSRKCQRKYKITQLKLQELYCYQRCISSHQAQRVMQKFKQFFVKKQAVQADDHNNTDRPLQLNDNNDVFIDDDNDGFGIPFNNNTQNNLFDVLLDGTIVQTISQPPVQQTIQTYIKDIVSDFNITEQCRIKRSQCLNQIKESMRKRFKYKEKGNNVNVPKTGGAQISLNNLIRIQLANEETSQFISAPLPESITKNISSVSLNQQQKKRKRKQDQFTLNWNDDALQDMRTMNQSLDRRISKVENLNDLLCLHVINDPKSQNYQKAFQTTIERVRQFPRTIQDIDVPKPLPTVRIADVGFDSQRQQHFSNEQYSIETLIDHFIQMSPYIFSEDLDLSHRNYKIQVDPKYLFTVGSIKDKDAILFKFDKGSVEIIDQKFFSRQTTPFGKLINNAQIFFLIEFYLSKFGNQWGLITECIRTNPFVRGMCLTSEQIQNLHSYYNLKRQKNISFSDKVILPFKDEFQQVQIFKQQKSQPLVDINEDNYQSYLQQQSEFDGEQNKVQEQSYVSKKFQSFIKKSEELRFDVNSNSFLDYVKNSNFKNYTNSKEEEHKVQEISDIKFDNHLSLSSFQPKQNSKSQKPNMTFRRRKIINQKTSALVGVLSKKKSSSYPYVRPQNARRQQSVVPPPQVVKTQSATSVPTKIPPAPKQSFPTSKTQDKTKTPVKKNPPTTPDQKKNSGGGGGAPAPSRRRKPDTK